MTSVFLASIVTHSMHPQQLWFSQTNIGFWTFLSVNSKKTSYYIHIFGKIDSTFWCIFVTPHFPWWNPDGSSSSGTLQSPFLLIISSRFMKIPSNPWRLIPSPVHFFEKTPPNEKWSHVSGSSSPPFLGFSHNLALLGFLEPLAIACRTRSHHLGRSPCQTSGNQPLYGGGRALRISKCLTVCNNQLELWVKWYFLTHLGWSSQNAVIQQECSKNLPKSIVRIHMIGI